MEELEAEKVAKEEEKVRYLGEKLPPLQLSGLKADDLQVSSLHSVSHTMACHAFKHTTDMCVFLQILCKDLHVKIDSVDEERYDFEAKVVKNNKDVWS